MSELKLHLSPRSTKYIQYWIGESMIDYKKPIGSMIYHFLEPSHPVKEKRAVYEFEDSLSVKIPFSSGSLPNPKTGRSGVWIAPDKMSELDDCINNYLRHEILIAIEYADHIQQKEIIERFQQKYGFLESEFSFDAIKKFLQRYKKKRNKLIIS